jgi:hypothetical protein
MKDGVHLAQPLHDVGCKQDGEEHSILFCDYLTCAQACVRSGIAVKEKDFFVFQLGPTLWMCCRSLFKVFLYRS